MPALTTKSNSFRRAPPQVPGRTVLVTMMRAGSAPTLAVSYPDTG